MNVLKKLTVTILTVVMLFALVVESGPANANTVSVYDITNISNEKVINSSSKSKVDNLKPNDDLYSSSESIITMVDKKVLDLSDQVTKEKLKIKLKADYDNNKYVILYSDGSNLSSEKVLYDTLQLPEGLVSEAIDSAAKENSQRLFAYGIVKRANGTPYIDSFYAAPGSEINDLSKQMDFLLMGYKNSMGIKDNTVNQINKTNKVKPQDVNSFPDYIRTQNFDYAEYGHFYTTTYIDRAVYRSDYSVWDVKGSNTTKAGYGMYSSSWWQVDALRTRYSVQAFGSEKIIDHGPTITPSGSSASVNLSSSGPSIGWSFPINDIKVIDDYNAIDKYGRWTFDYARWSAVARGTYKSEPGARYTNTLGNMALDVSQAVEYWNSFNGALNEKYTGTYRYYFADR